MGDIVWLASYPKSGNTWLRVFLANLRSASDRPVEINHLRVGLGAAGRGDFDLVLGIESSDLTKAEINDLRPRFYRLLASATPGPLYLKVHDAFAYTQRGEPLFPTDLPSRAVYIVRNPLDVSVSLAQHGQISLDRAISYMADPEFAFCSRKDRLYDQLEQSLMSWSGHVSSWLDQKHIPVHLMRYEDMLREPVSTFSGCVKFLGIQSPAGEIERALSFSSFSVLSSQEQASGFREKPPRAKSFFRSGKEGDWQNHLTDRQRDLIVAAHGQVMGRLGYRES